MEQLECAVQNYEWGKYGKDSIVARFILNDQELTTKENVPYAELWMGTHPNGPSKLKNSHKNLEDYLKENPQFLGKHENEQLNFLFKILSVRRALSIQSHPTKDEAEKLHAKDPKNYPDSNHKPEMAIALTDFEVLCGFQRPQNILFNFKAHSELLELVNEDFLSELAALEENPNDCRNVLKQLFSGIWKSKPEEISKVVCEIVDRISEKGNRSDMDDLMLRLNEQNPGGDVGVLAPIFLNHFTLKPGQASFIGPNEPHAYLFGDCVECMACSDNTIRAGLTPKFKDIQTLCENLTYRMSDPLLFEPKNISPGVLEYAPPVFEFSVHRINNEAKSLCQLESGSILIVLDGEANLKVSKETYQNLTKKSVWFLSKNHEELALEKVATDFLAFRAFCPKKNTK